jgi:hypothetical protein
VVFESLCIQFHYTNDRNNTQIQFEYMRVLKFNCILPCRSRVGSVAHTAFSGVAFIFGSGFDFSGPKAKDCIGVVILNQLLRGLFSNSRLSSPTKI